jgi:salicylate hydroxylase
MNIVAFHESDGTWEDTERLTKPGRREDALRDFAGWSDNVTKLLSMCEEELPIVSAGYNVPN